MRRLLEAINAIVESTVGRKLDYHALYPCTVATQAADYTLDLIPDDERVRGSGTSGIKLRHGLPGFVATVPTGARVLMGFEAGDPKRPYAMAWDVGSVTSVTFDGGTKSVGRIDDHVQIGTLAGAAPPGGGAVTFTYIPYDVGAPGTQVGALIDFSGGLISEDNAKLKA